MEKESKPRPREIKKDGFVVDTSALLSLESTKLLKSVTEIADLLIPAGVLKELEDISKQNDDLAKVAERVLKQEENIFIEHIENTKKIPFIQDADNECFNLAKKHNLTLITDDLKAIYHIADKVKTMYSTFFLVALIQSGALSKQKGLNLLEELRDMRSWENNIIYLKTKKSIQELKD